jgi:phosphoglycerate dehydrogenase-like enzyme
MSMPPPLVLVTEGSDPLSLQWLRERAEVVEVQPNDPRFGNFLARASGLLVRTYTRVDDSLLSRAPNLKVVARAGVGLDNIDVSACRHRGVEVVHTPDANTIAVGDYVIAVMLQLIRPWAYLRAGAYDPADFKRVRNEIRGNQLDELTLGILGLGRVGRRVARIASAGFGMRVLYNDLLDPGPLLFAATSVDKPTLYRQSDVLSVHVDLRSGNEKLVGREQLALMKPGAILINSSRGEVVDGEALAAALRENKLAGAALDVFAPEPPPADLPLLGMANVLLTPHIASRTDKALASMSWVVRDLAAVLAGQPPKHPAP